MVAANGLRMPITLYEDAVLDGWHRYTACTQIGIDPTYTKFTGGDAEARRFAVSVNLVRRHLDTSERAMVAGKFANMPAHRPDASTRANLPTSVEEAATLLNVSERSVKDARAVLATEDKDLIAQVESGQVSVSKAAGRCVRRTRRRRRWSARRSLKLIIRYGCQLLPLG